MRLESPIWLAAFALLALGILARMIFGQAGLRARPAILFSNVPPMRLQKKTLRQRLKKGALLFRILALSALIVALARPQIGRADTVVSSEGIDVVLVVDHSLSMVGEDFGDGKTRLEHVTEVVTDFVASRNDDRLGLISFGSYAYTRCPMTLDHELVADFLRRGLQDWLAAKDGYWKKNAGLIRGELSPREEDLQGTAIGEGLLAAINRLEESNAKSKVVVLLSDGEQTAGETSPEDAAALAQKFGVKVYTVGAGADRACKITVFNRLGQKVQTRQRFKVDEAALRKIASTTGGEYFHATDRDGLEKVYEKIDRLERSTIETKDYREWEERFMPLAWLALLMILVEAALMATVFRTIP